MHAKPGLRNHYSDNSDWIVLRHMEDHFSLTDRARPGYSGSIEKEEGDVDPVSLHVRLETPLIRSHATRRNELRQMHEGKQMLAEVMRQREQVIYRRRWNSEFDSQAWL